MNFKNRDIISITDLSRDEILYLCKKGKEMHDADKNGERHKLAAALKRRALAYMFYEPSTRTKTSFITAMRELGGRVDGFAGKEGTSVMKKETIRDTIVMMGANHFDVVVMRHPLDGSLQWAADVSDIPVINGGDGKNEHPTQSLLDMLTIYMFNNGTFDGLNIGFGGDLAYGRTIKSLSLALSHFDDITIRWAAEDFLGMPEDLASLLDSRGVKVARLDSVKEVMKASDFYYMTRPQIERMPGISQEEIIAMMETYRIDLDKVKETKPGLKIMHPLPVNSEVAEMDYGVYFQPCQGFFQQAENGIFTRKALLYEILKHDGYTRFSATLDPQLHKGNNRVKRSGGKARDHMFIDKIQDGTVLDHLVRTTQKEVSAVLNLEQRGYSDIPVSIEEKTNPMLKTSLPRLTERELKRIAAISPEPTVNYIQEGQITEKFVYLLCQNGNCVTRVPNEEVPPKFYNDNDTIRCRYCRKVYSLQTKKITQQELNDYKDSLPTRIEPVRG